MLIKQNDFRRYLKNVSFVEHGDSVERDYGQLVTDFFPNCEEFWKVFVVPLTKRICGYPETITRDIDLRAEIDDKVAVIANLHYSMFLNLVFARRHILENQIALLENVYAHLGAACDLAERILVKWFILLKKCKGEDVKLLQSLTKPEFLEIAGDWYDTDYRRFYEISSERGKLGPIHLLKSEDILCEYLGKSSTERKDYFRTSRTIRELRNAIVHDLKIARIVIEDDQYLVPKSSRIQEYRSWRVVAEAAKDPAKVSKDFLPAPELCKQDLGELSSRLNSLWSFLINDYLEELFSSDRDVLRKLFGIYFAAGPTVILSDLGNDPERHDFPSPSGTYHGGTADISKLA